MSLVEKNIEALSKQDLPLANRLKETVSHSEFQIEKAKNGEQTALINGQQIYSKYSPNREVERFFEAQPPEDATLFFFFGFGLGLHLQEFLKRVQPDQSIHIVIVEPDITLFKSALEIIDLAPIIQTPFHFSFLIGYTPESVLHIATDAGYPHYQIITTKGLQLGREAWFNQAENLLIRYQESWQVNLNTGKQFSRLWLRHLFSCLQRIEENRHEIKAVSQLNQKFQGVDALIAAAGPTLESSVEILKEYAQNGLLIAVDTAMRFLIENEIIPHLVVISDCQYWNSRHLDRIDLQKVRILTELSVHPSLFSKSTGTVYLYSSRIPAQRAVESLTGDFGALGTGGSVATTAWDFARSAGCKTITCCGLDLSYPNGKTHIKEGRFEQQVFSQCRRQNSIENSNMNLLHHPLSRKTKDDKGNLLFTDERMLLFRNWFEQQIERYPGNYYRIDQNAIPLKGMQSITPQQLKSQIERNPRILSKFKKIEQDQKGICFTSHLKSLFVEKLKEAEKQLNLLNRHPSGIELLNNPFLALLYYEILQDQQKIQIGHIDWSPLSSLKRQELTQNIEKFQL